MSIQSTAPVEPSATGSPFFSIIVPTYNRAAFLPGLIEKMLSQEFAAWELIIVDDGSTDQTKLVVQEYEDPRIRYFYQSNQERSAARNHGIRRSAGKFICFLDSDDYYDADYLGKLHDAILVNLKQNVIYCSGATIRGGPVEIRKEPVTKIKGRALVREFFWTPPMVCNLCTPRQFLLDEQFIETQNIWEDVHLSLRLAMKHEVIPVYTYGVIVVEHAGRSGAAFFSKTKMDSLEQYVANIQHLFEHSEISKYVSNGEKARFLREKAEMMAYTAAVNGELKKYFRCMALSIKFDPLGILKSKMYRFSVQTMRIILGGKIRKMIYGQTAKTPPAL